MSILIIDEDFIGKWDLAKNNNDNIEEYIEEYEEQYLIELLGKELFDLFEADLIDKVPQTQIYIDIFAPFTEEINQFSVSSKGMKKMLLGLIYFQYVRDNRIKQTMSGAVEQQTEVSVKSDNTFIYQRYNDGVRTYQAIQMFINDNLDIYPTFNGVCKKMTSMI